MYLQLSIKEQLKQAYVASDDDLAYTSKKNLLIFVEINN